MDAVLDAVTEGVLDLVGLTDGVLDLVGLTEDVIVRDDVCVGDLDGV